MKKIFLTTAAILAGFLLFANAGSGKETKKQLRRERREQRRELWLHSVNVMTEEQFYRDFPNARNVQWTEDEFAEAAFNDGAVLKTAYYDEDNQLVGTTTDVAYSTLPAKAKQYISKKYPGYSIEKVILFDDNEANDTDMFLFSNFFEDEDTYFPVLSKDSNKIILRVTMGGGVSFFRDYK